MSKIVRPKTEEKPDKNIKIESKGLNYDEDQDAVPYTVRFADLIRAISLAELRGYRFTIGYSRTFINDDMDHEIIVLTRYKIKHFSLLPQEGTVDKGIIGAIKRNIVARIIGDKSINYLTGYSEIGINIRRAFSYPEELNLAVSFVTNNSE